MSAAVVVVGSRPTSATKLAAASNPRWENRKSFVTRKSVVRIFHTLQKSRPMYASAPSVNTATASWRAPAKPTLPSARLAAAAGVEMRTTLSEVWSDWKSGGNILMNLVLLCLNQCIMLTGRPTAARFQSWYVNGNAVGASWWMIS